MPTTPWKEQAADGPLGGTNKAGFGGWLDSFLIYPAI